MYQLNKTNKFLVLEMYVKASPENSSKMKIEIFSCRSALCSFKHSSIVIFLIVLSVPRCSLVIYKRLIK